MSEGINEKYSSVRVSSAPVPALPWSLLFFLALLSTSQASNCERPFSVQHGRVNVSETNRGFFLVGTVLQYSCDSGFTVDGPSIVVCTRDGLWSSGPPRCVHTNYCVTPPKPENGGYTCHPHPCHYMTPGTVIKFFCDVGYTLKGDSKHIACQNGEWDGSTQVSCVPTQGCARPFPVRDGQVNVSETIRGSFPVGTVLQYSCDSGLTMKGANIIVCTKEGLWSSSPPRCLQLCSPPTEPENGGYICHPSPCEELITGVVLEFYCDEGYALKGDDKYITCLNDGEWYNSAKVSCVPTKGCARPFSVQHGRVNVSETNRDFFPVSTVLQYSCDSGFSVDGPTIVICTRDGLWSSGPPRCLHNNLCSPPFEPENGGYTCHPSPCPRLTHGIVVEYFCDEGYTLKGDYKYLTCQNGEWDSPVQISCVLSHDKNPTPLLGMNTLSIVASTASSVALALLLVVLLVLLQPRLKTFHHGRREHGSSGQSVTIMVDGVQVTLPSYEEAVSGAAGLEVPQGQTHTQLETLEEPSTQALTAHTQHSEIAVVHRPPSSTSSSSSSSPSSSSSWSLDNAQGATAASAALQNQNAYTTPQESMLSLHSPEQDLADDIPLLKES
ncbi:sushi domain-containing protein 4-like [Hoplias malabaricus]|uniref:sushi domain-containing protein 4-like n=1 Tax=Hoplias malabaricus TaxID=27720 RepID=UPI003462402E